MALRKSPIPLEWRYNKADMRRLISIAALALLLAVPVWAQRGGHGGGGHVGGGMHGGFAGHAGGGRSFSGMHSGGMRSGAVFTSNSSHSFNHGTWHGPFVHNGFHHNQFHNFGFRNNCFGAGCWAWGGWYPWWGSYYSPVWSTWEDQDRRFDEEYYRQYEIAHEWNRQNLEEQRMLRQEEADGDDDAYAPRTSGRGPSNTSQPQDPVPATVLVFRDQHKEEVSNYAIVGTSLWSFSGQRTKKIPMADLDLAATEKANDDRGVTFRVPGANQGQ
jgi:hypothetical protein